MSRCRGCGEEIGFVKLRSGKVMPVESDEPEEYQVWLDPPMERVPTVEPPADGSPGPIIEHRRLVLVTTAGDVLVVWVAFLVEHDRRSPLGGPCTIHGYESHFARCPKAKEFRR